MANASNWQKKYNAMGKQAQLVVLPLMALVAIGAIVLAIIAIVALPTVNDGKQRGVGAYGFRAFKEEGTDLGISKVVPKNVVENELGDKAIKVDDPNVSDVFNLDGNRGQTATYDFIRSDGVTSSVYVDVMLFKNTTVMDAAHILASTAEAGTVKDYPAYFMRAQTLGTEREYRLLVVNGLKAYKFVMAQPSNNIKINEVAAVATLKRLAEKANL